MKHLTGAFIFGVFVVFAAPLIAQAEESAKESKEKTGTVKTAQRKTDAEKMAEGVIPFKYLFYRMHTNALYSAGYNCGLNFIGAGLVTFELAASGGDWQFYKMMYKKREALNGVRNAFDVMAYPVSVAAPLTFYITGRILHDKKMQAAGLAAGQAELIGKGFEWMFRLFIKRVPPVTTYDGFYKSPADPRIKSDYSREFTYGFTNFNIMDGWPSGHTLDAFAMAAAMSEIYSDSILVKIICYTYASAMGVAISIKDHWLSDVFAGALIGFAIGKVTGRTFKNLLDKNDKEGGKRLVFSGNFVGIAYSF